MRFAVALFAAALAGSAHAAKIDLAKLAEARSLVAEAAAIEQDRARLTGPYAQSLRNDIRKDLEGLLKDPSLGPFVKAAIAAIDGRDGPGLAAIRDRLVNLEEAHGRAG